MIDSQVGESVMGFSDNAEAFVVIKLKVFRDFRKFKGLREY